MTQVKTRKIPATKTGGVCVEAKAASGTVRVPWDHSKDGWEAHAVAVRMLFPSALSVRMTSEHATGYTFTVTP